MIVRPCTRADFEAFLRDEVGIRADLDRSVAVPGEGACLLEPDP